MNPLASPEARKKLRGNVICEPRAKLMTDSALLNSRGRLHPTFAINRSLAEPRTHTHGQRGDWL